MATYRINERYSHGRDVEAATFSTNGEFVDFYNEEGECIYRMRAESCQTIERVTDQSGR